MIRLIPSRRPDLTKSVDDRFYEVFPYVTVLTLIGVFAHAYLFVWSKSGFHVSWKLKLLVLSLGVIGGFVQSILLVIFERALYSYREGSSPRRGDRGREEG